LGRRPLGAILHSSNEPGELSQWLCHDDSTINIVVLIIIIIIMAGSVCSAESAKCRNLWFCGLCDTGTIDYYYHCHHHHYYTNKTNESISS